MNNEQYFRMAIPTFAPENKFNLTVEEACAYFNIGETTFRKLLDVEPNADYILYVGKKKLIKKKAFEDWVLHTAAIW